MSDNLMVELADRIAAALVLLHELTNGQKRIQETVNRVGTWSREVDKFQERMRTDLMARMDRLQDSLTAIRDDIAINYGAADQVRRAHDNTREQLRALADTQATMLRQIQRLQTDMRILKGEP
jgi:uncharacterized membrane protein YccC